MDSNELMQLSHLDTMLARATRIDEITDLRAKFEAMRVYHVNIGESRDKCNGYALARVRAERKAGEMLLSLDMSGNNQHSDGYDGVTVTLEKLGIKKHISHRWQSIAKLPDELFDELSLERLKSGDDVTTNYFYKAGRIHNMRQRGISTDRAYTPPATITISTTDMPAAARVLRKALSAKQVTQLIDELRKEQS